MTALDTLAYLSLMVSSPLYAVLTVLWIQAVRWRDGVITVQVNALGEGWAEAAMFILLWGVSTTASLGLLHRLRTTPTTHTGP